MKRYIIIEQYLGNAWVELITLDAKGDPTKEELIETVSTLAEKIHDNESVFFIKDDGASVITNKINGPIRLRLMGGTVTNG